MSYLATQYALLFSSMIAAAAEVCGGLFGDYVNAFGYAQFFTSTACWVAGAAFCWCGWHRASRRSVAPDIMPRQLSINSKS